MAERTDPATPSPDDDERAILAAGLTQDDITRICTNAVIGALRDRLAQLTAAQSDKAA